MGDQSFRTPGVKKTSRKYETSESLDGLDIYTSSTYAQEVKVIQSPGI